MENKPFINLVDEVAPVPVIKEESGKMRILLDKLLPILRKVGENPIAIVSINGALRTGKSYILGHFMRFLTNQNCEDFVHKELKKEFHWKKATKRQTSGILIWPEPFFIKAGQEKIAVLLMDTQGSFDGETSYIINYILFAFSCLLSSVLIYNVRNSLSEENLQFLHMFLRFARIPLENGTYDKFDNLVIMIRDWQNDDEYECGYHDKDTPKEQNFFTEVFDARSDMVEDVKLVRTEVMSSFRSVACCLLPHPGLELACEDKTDKLDENFSTALKKAIPKICSRENIVVKTIGGQKVTGTFLASVVKGWDALFEKVSCEDIKPIASMVAEKQTYAARCKALQFYETHMKVIRTVKGLSDKFLENLHQKVKDIAINLFEKDQRIKYSSIESESLEHLKADIQRAFQSFREMNETRRRFGVLEAKYEEQRKQHAENLKKIEIWMEIKAGQDRQEFDRKQKMLKNKFEQKYKTELENMRRDTYQLIREKDEEMKRARERNNKLSENLQMDMYWQQEELKKKIEARRVEFENQHRYMHAKMEELEDEHYEERNRLKDEHRESLRQQRELHRRKLNEIERKQYGFDWY